MAVNHASTRLGMSLEEKGVGKATSILACFPLMFVESLSSKEPEFEYLKELDLVGFTTKFPLHPTKLNVIETKKSVFVNESICFFPC
jgi:hypothetical protein